MKVLILFLIFSTCAYASDILEITTKEGSFLCRLVEKNDAGITVDRNGRIIKYNYSDITYKQVPFPFKKVLVLKNKTYMDGNIVFMSLDKVSVEKNNELISINTVIINNIVEPKMFHHEMSKSNTRALLLSLFYPGLGQLYTTGREHTGAAFMMGFTASSFLSVFFYNKFKDNEDLYQESGGGNRNYYDNARRYRWFSIGFAIASVSIYSLSLYDSYANFRHYYEVENYKAGEGRSELSFSKKF